MFGRFKKWAGAGLMALSLCVTAPVMAAIDVSSATTAITEAQTGGVTVLTALVVAFGVFLGYQIVKSLLKRG